MRRGSLALYDEILSKSTSHVGGELLRWVQCWRSNTLRVPPMKQVAKPLSIPFVLMCTLVLLATLAVTPASAVEEDIDHEAAKELHDALQDAKEHGDPIVGDISEKALIKEIESKRQGLPGGLQQA